MALSYYQQTVSDLVRDDANQILPEHIERAIDAAVRQLSQDAPREPFVDLVGTGAQMYALPEDWASGSSRVVSIECPIGELPPRMLDRQRIFVTRDAAGAERVGIQDGLAVGTLARLRYTAPHTVSGQTDTVPEPYRWPVACYAASLLCGQLASWYANQTDSTIGADAVDHKSKSELWRSREREYERKYYIGVGLPVPSSGNAGAGTSGQTLASAGAVVSFAPRRDKVWRRPAW